MCMHCNENKRIVQLYSYLLRYVVEYVVGHTLSVYTAFVG